MKRLLTAILILASMYGYGMGFTGYNTYKLDTPPGTGVNPPAGYIFTWVTVSTGIITHHFRDSSGTDHTFAFADYTNPANIVQAASYRFVTDTEKSTWNGKQDALAAASGSVSGYLTSSDWTTFNSKQAALGFIPVESNTAITGATKTKVTYDAKGLVTSGADATTADIADSTDKRYCSDAQKTVIGNTSGTNTGDETQSTIKTKLGAATASVDGYATAAQITKLDGIAAGANNYVHPTTDGSLHVPATSTTSDGKLLQAGPTAGSFSWVVGSPSMVQLGNVTNESKATMFTNPVFTGSITIPKIKPAADSATAIQVTKSDGSTILVNYDTVNSRVGYGTATPAASLHIKSSDTGGNSPGFKVERSTTSNLTHLQHYYDGISYLAQNYYRTTSAWAQDLVTDCGAGIILDTRSTTGNIYFFTTPPSASASLSDYYKMCILQNGNTGIGVSNPTAVLHLKGGTAAAGTAPLKFTAGTNLSTPESGVIEYDGSYTYYTNGSAVRRRYTAHDSTTIGSVVLTAGTATISTSKVTANSVIILTCQSLGTVTSPKAIAVTSRTAGTSFVITSADATDTSTIAWMIIEPI